jgi:oxygen-independent coproporphyrinogen-3 oxidase
MVNAICDEIILKKQYFSQNLISSIYFGGGTPSILSENALEKILNSIHQNFTIDKKSEITLEANPDDITNQKLKAWSGLGINRLSIGLQSFNDEELKWMNRAHNAQESETSIKMAQDQGFNNITIDLIYGSKFQTLKSWEHTLQKAIQLKTQHISSYNLTIEQKTVLGLKHRKGQEPAVNDELSSLQFLMMIDVLTSADFLHYEISNFGKENYFAIHNSNYWLGKSYIGVGPSAHSYNGKTRQWNIKSNPQYIKKIKEKEPYFEIENLTLENKYNEYVLTRLRTIWGCDINEIKKLFGNEIANHFLLEIKKKINFIIENKGTYTLNTQGKLQADGIASDLFL